jgi:HSP20 family protein
LKYQTLTDKNSKLRLVSKRRDNMTAMDLEKFGTTGAIQELLSIRDDIETLSTLGSDKDAISPKIDLFDLGDSYRLIIEVPGVPQENLELALQERTLIVAGLREPIEPGLKIITSERHRGHFQRSIELPSEIEKEKVSAHLQEGLLILNLPKEEGGRRKEEGG